MTRETLPAAMMMSEECRRVCEGSGGRLTIRDLQPRWDAQKLRVLVPCVGTQEYHWARGGFVVPLGQWS